jgi:hypothetical protein
MCCKKWIVAAIAFSTVLIVPFSFKKQISFSNLAEAHSQINELGYCCISDRRDGVIENGFAVSREKLAWNDVNHLIKIGPRGPEWHGKIWLGVIEDDLSDLYSIPNWPGTRVWGNIIAFGDAELLDELEAQLSH